MIEGEQVLKLVEASGYTQHASKCALAAIAGQFLTFHGTPEELDKQAIFKGEPMALECYECKGCVRPTLRELLQQGEDGGDYEDDYGDFGNIKCPKCKNDIYVPSLCVGSPSTDCGKYFKHCTECEGFGTCIGDYRNAHCAKCGKHYYTGLSGLPCPCRQQKEGLKQIMGILGFSGDVSSKFVEAFGDELLDEDEGCGECDGCLDSLGCDMLEDEEEAKEQKKAAAARTKKMQSHLLELALQEEMKKTKKAKKGKRGRKEEDCATM